MPRLLAIEGQDEVSIDGIADLGAEVAFFTSEEGQEPDIVADLTFNKKDFTSYEDFQVWLGERMPEYNFLQDRPNVPSLNYEDLIDICTTQFPDLMYDDGSESPYDDSELEGKPPEKSDIPENSKKLKQMPIKDLEDELE